jgi:methylenetetrahydrofolate reductase (NADPH)
MFFDTAVYKQFVHDCRQAGITCPIVPGIMCINTYAGFVKMAGFCKTRVPIALAEQLAHIQHDPVALKEFGIEFAAQQCQELLTGESLPEFTRILNSQQRSINDQSTILEKCYIQS